MAELLHHQRPESWGARARDYESIFVPFSQAAARRAVELAEIGPGDRYLDVAAGTGALTLAAAAAGASVTAIDFAEGMLDILREKLARAGVDDVEVRQMDGQALEFGDGEFDAVGSGFGLVFFPDPPRGVREMRRVLTSGGRAIVTSTGHPGSSDLQVLLARAMARAAGSDPQVPRPGARRFAAPGVDDLARWMTDAGFVEVRVECNRIPWPVPDPAIFWEKWALDSPLSAAAMSVVPPDLRTAAGKEFVRLVEAAGTSVFDTEVFLALGRAP